MKLIDKDVLIEKINDLKFKINWALEDFSGAKEIAYDDILDVIYRLEVKEVDLEKEYKMFVNCDNGRSMFETAKHFFELGLKVQKKVE